jgi:hypothetical protein
MPYLIFDKEKKEFKLFRFLVEVAYYYNLPINSLKHVFYNKKETTHEILTLSILKINFTKRT